LANVNRYIGGKRDSLLITVNASVTVQIGDLMFLDKIDNLRNNGSSTADSTAYPIEHLRISGASLEANKVALKSYFLGVAMDDKDGISNGADLNIPIATSGIFEYDLKPGRTVEIGEYFAASGTTVSSNMFNQKVMKTSDETKAIGYFSERKLHANTAEGFIRTSIGNKI